MQQSEPEEAPAKKKRRRKKKPAVQPTPVQPAVPDYEPEPAPAALRREKPKLTRPGTRFDTGNQMPVVEFDRPDPLAGDRIMAMGSPKDLENFCFKRSTEGVRPVEGARLRTLKDYIESQESGPQAHQLLCYGVPLEKEMPQADRPLRDSGIKEDWKAFLIGLERDLLPIPNPDKDMTLRQGDLLWVMGSQEMAGELMRRGLLD